MSLLGFQIISAGFLFLTARYFKGVCRVEKSAIKEFIKFMAFLTMFRLILASIGGIHAPSDASSVMKSLSLVRVLGVFWEDTFFTLPILIMERLKVHKLLIYLMLGCSALVFASGHLAYGIAWASLTLFYIPFVSFRYSKTRGLGTVIICHILYDFITLLTFKLLW